MGFYWHSAIYYGKIISKSHYDMIKSNIENNDWITNINDPHGLMLLHIPKCYIRLGSLDPVLEDHDIKNGYANMSNIIKIFGDLVKPILNITDEDKNKLNDLLNICKLSDPNVYIIETSSSTLDDELISYINHNIVVIK